MLFRSVVLHDGAAVGYRMQEERECPVFNVLEMFTPSAFETRIATVVIESEADLEALDVAFTATQSSFEDWTQNIRSLCKACSEGRPHANHDHELEEQWLPERRLGIAVYPGDDIDQILNRWQEATSGKILSIEPAALR